MHSNECVRAFAKLRSARLKCILLTWPFESQGQEGEWLKEGTTAKERTAKVGKVKIQKHHPRPVNTRRWAGDEASHPNLVWRSARKLDLSSGGADGSAWCWSPGCYRWASRSRPARESGRPGTADETLDRFVKVEPGPILTTPVKAKDGEAWSPNCVWLCWCTT